MEKAWEYAVVNRFDIFPYFWLGVVTLIGTMNVAWAVNDLRVGSARFSWMSTRASREEEPFEFWMAVLGKFAGGIVACVMFYLGLDMLNW